MYLWQVTCTVCLKMGSTSEGDYQVIKMRLLMMTCGNLGKYRIRRFNQHVRFTESVLALLLIEFNVSVFISVLK